MKNDFSRGCDVICEIDFSTGSAFGGVREFGFGRGERREEEK